jgi:hypothetical protein
VRRRLGVAIVSYALHRPPRTSPSTDVPLGPLRAPLVAVVPRRSYGPTLMQRFGLVVVDPVRAFTDPDGVTVVSMAPSSSVRFARPSKGWRPSLLLTRVRRSG